jgi:plasmid stabilization system protein ParE
MEYEVIVEDRAREDMLGIAAWIARDSPASAMHWMVQIWEAVESLGQFPLRCPIAPEAGVHGAEVRHRIVGEYRILFSVRGERVIILHVRHSARRHGERRKDLD